MKSKMIGVYMDHATARLIDPSGNPLGLITSAFTHAEKEFALSKSENLMHNKEQGEQMGYYKEITDRLKEHDHILLFGPTTAKNELYNLLKGDHAFQDAEIDVQQTDKLHENLQDIFVKDHFTVNK